jgi:exopolysaccharide biosynthesis polyprenyl glycosylphosphotransferase
MGEKEHGRDALDMDPAEQQAEKLILDKSGEGAGPNRSAAHSDLPGTAGRDAAVGGTLTAALSQPRWRHDALRRRLLLAADAVAVIAGSVLFIPSEAGAFWALTFVPVWILLAKALGNYDRDHQAIRHLTIDELPQVVAWAALGSLALSLYLPPTSVGTLSGATVLYLCLATAAGALLLRAMVRWLWRRYTPSERAILVGAGGPAEAIRRKLHLLDDMNIRLLDTVEPPHPGESAQERAERFGRLAERADRIILAAPQLTEDMVAQLRVLCRERQVKLSMVSPLRGRALPASQTTQVADLPILEFDTWDISRSTIVLKRSFDLLVSAVLLILAAPLFLLIPIAIRLDSKGKALFAQTRAGEGGRPFRMRKFRTMQLDAEDRLDEVVRLADLDEPMFKLEGDPRVTRVGRFLRRTSLDELPQLINVLLGDMSIVGPRPEQLELVKRYRPEHLFRLAVKPGLTGPMQVYGRGNLTFAERLAVELDYIENLSLGRDLRLLALTTSAVLRRNGAY